MNLILNWFESLIQFFFMIFKLVGWFLGGLINLGTVLMESVNVFMEVMDFLPPTAAMSLAAVCGILVTLRILGAVM